MEYQIIKEDKFDEVIQHLRHNFPDEPLNAAVGLAVHGRPCEILEKYDIITMKEGMSLVAVDKDTGVIAGVALNGACKKGDIEEHIEELKSIDNLAYQRIFGLLNNANKELDLFAKYGIDKIFELRILCVDSRFRGRGVAKELFEKSEAVAVQNGFRLMKLDATSLFTQRISENFGYISEKAVKYGDFYDEKGKKMYPTESPHDYYKVMAKQLPGQ